MIILLSAMARTKEFDEAAVLDQAVELFRSCGYQSTSFADLTAQLGVSRQSLYDTYGDKQTLFHAALKRYRERALDHIGRLLATPGPVRPVLLQLFEGALAGCCAKDSPGCFMVNSMVEVAPQDAAIRAMALAHARDLEGLLATRLSAAQRSGDLSKDKDPAALARFLHHTLLGLSVAARALNERDSLRESARLALLALD
jgi:TetR/AcrR family transcriptional repressor of nem operon